MKKSEIETKLKEKGIFPSTLSIRQGIITFRKGFFYTHGNSASKYANQIQKTFPNTTILEARDVWKSFRGGASVANSSHFLIKFRFHNQE